MPIPYTARMSARQRLVVVFVIASAEHGRDEVLLVQRPGGALAYAGRWTTVSGIVGTGESAAAAASRAVLEELPSESLELERGGLYVDFTDTLRKRSVAFRLYPFLARVPAGARRPALPASRWVRPDDLVLASALGETVPELDEALARVWDPPAALPPQFRAEAGAVRVARAGSRELALRAVAMVAGGAPPERVAALRPELARFVNAARAAVSPERPVAAELAAAARAEARAVASVVEGAARPGGVGPLPEVPGRVLLPPARDLDLLILAAEAVLPRGDIVAHAGALAAARALPPGVPVVASTDAWATWEDELPPPAAEGLEVVPRELVTRVIGSWN